MALREGRSEGPRVTLADMRPCAPSQARQAMQYSSRSHQVISLTSRGLKSKRSGASRTKSATSPVDTQPSPAGRDGGGRLVCCHEKRVRGTTASHRIAHRPCP